MTRLAPRCDHEGGEWRMLQNPLGPESWPFWVCDECAAGERAHERRRLVGRLLERSGVSPRMLGWSWETLPAGVDRRAVEAVERWVEQYRAGERRNLLLYGNVGAGKTGLAWAAGRRLLEEDAVPVWFALFRELLQELVLTNFGSSSDLDRAAHVSVLLLDDVGAESRREWPRLELASIVERRYGRRLPVVMTSNYSPSQLARRLGRDDLDAGRRIVSRLGADAVQVEFKGRDLRMQADFEATG